RPYTRQGFPRLVKIRLHIARRVATPFSCKTFKIGSRVASFDCLNLRARLRRNRFALPQSRKESCFRLRFGRLRLAFRNSNLSSYDENLFVDLKLELLYEKFSQVLPY